MSWSAELGAEMAPGCVFGRSEKFARDSLMSQSDSEQAISMSNKQHNFMAIAMLTLGVWAGPTPAGASTHESLAIVGATLFDATGSEPYVGTVLIRDGSIVEVGRNVKVPPGTRTVRASGKALLPGFFDVHTHWSPSGVPSTLPQIANAYLAAGVTTVNDFHQPPESFEPRRRWLSTLLAPHVNFVARMSTPGGHGADWADTATTKWVNTPEAARAEVQSLLPYRPDFIKVFADGWRYGQSPDNTSMNLQTLAALVDEAHKNSLEVLTHTVTVERGKDAARAHVDVIAHSLQDRLLDAEAIELMKSNRTYYAPTLAIYEPVKPAEPTPANLDDPALKLRLRKFDHALKNVKTLHDAGVVIVVGTDAGIGGAKHGLSTLHEMELLVRAGLTAAEALTAATANSAKALNVSNDRGTIEPGKRADLVLIDGTPWVDISDVNKVDRVFIGGRLAYGKGAVPPTANTLTSMPALMATPLIDDFENPSGRTSIDTLRLDNFDSGADRSSQVSALIARSPGDHALAVTARMARKAEPSAGVILPLSRGSVAPVDARAFKGVRFELRGDGDYAFKINTLAGTWSANVSGTPQWHQVEIPFSLLQRQMPRSSAARAEHGEAPVEWSGNDLLEVEFGGKRPAGNKFWMEIDNISFYR
jgi:imidazolonepropionase-like amidohydrolase